MLPAITPIQTRPPGALWSNLDGFHPVDGDVNADEGFLSQRWILLEIPCGNGGAGRLAAGISLKAAPARLCKGGFSACWVRVRTACAHGADLQALAGVEEEEAAAWIPIQFGVFCAASVGPESRGSGFAAEFPQNNGSHGGSTIFGRGRQGRPAHGIAGRTSSTFKQGKASCLDGGEAVPAGIRHAARPRTGVARAAAGVGGFSDERGKAARQSRARVADA